MRRSFRTALAGSTLLLFVIPCAPHAQSIGAPPSALAPLAQRRAELNNLFRDYWDAYLERNPEFASTIGDKRYNDKISDYSVAALNNWLARERQFQVRLAMIDPTGFTDREKLSQELLMRQFREDADAAEFKEWEMPVNQTGGIYSCYPRLVTHLNFATLKDYDDWIARLHAIPRAIQQVTTNMSIGMEDHRVPPAYLLEKVLVEVDELANQKPADSPLAAPLKQFPASIPAPEQARIRAGMLAAIANQVLPAYKRFARFLRVSYIPAGREQPGISALPDGVQYYRFLVRRTTTIDLTPAQIHQIGLEAVKRDEAAMLVIAKSLGYQDLKSFQTSLKSNPKLHPASRQALLDAYRGYLNAMQAELPILFGHLPAEKLDIQAAPAYLEKDAPPAYYQPGSPDGSRPGLLFINTGNDTGRNLYSVENIVYRYGVPGRHLQTSLAQEIAGLPAFRRYKEYPAYTEGWSLYAGQLGKDAGFYKDPYSDYGRLENDLLWSIWLVVDTGVHSEGWTRAQAIQYLHDHSDLDDATIQVEVDSDIALPSQALASKTGELDILGLREKARSELGGNFDLRAFHGAILDSGALPLDLLNARVIAWIGSQKTSTQR